MHMTKQDKNFVLFSSNSHPMYLNSYFDLSFFLLFRESSSSFSYHLPFTLLLSLYFAEFLSRLSFSLFSSFHYPLLFSPILLHTMPYVSLKFLLIVFNILPFFLIFIVIRQPFFSFYFTFSLSLSFLPH